MRHRKCARPRLRRIGFTLSCKHCSISKNLTSMAFSFPAQQTHMWTDITLQGFIFISLAVVFFIHITAIGVISSHAVTSNGSPLPIFFVCQFSISGAIRRVSVKHVFKRNPLPCAVYAALSYFRKFWFPYKSFTPKMIHCHFSFTHRCSFRIYEGSAVGQHFRFFSTINRGMCCNWRWLLTPWLWYRSSLFVKFNYSRGAFLHFTNQPNVCEL